MAIKYRKDPRVTNDRVPPEWFLAKLAELDPCLKVEWWNEHPAKGPTFRLIRVVPDGRYAEIDYFRYEDEMHVLYKWLKECDTHARHKEKLQVYHEQMKASRAKILADRKLFAHRAESIATETAETFLRSKDRMWSIPGVSVRRDWNQE